MLCQRHLTGWADWMMAARWGVHAACGYHHDYGLLRPGRICLLSRTPDGTYHRRDTVWPECGGSGDLEPLFGVCAL